MFYDLMGFAISSAIFLERLRLRSTNPLMVIPLLRAEPRIRLASSTEHRSSMVVLGPGGRVPQSCANGASLDTEKNFSSTSMARIRMLSI